MESNFSNRDFEQYVKQNADQYRMFPSDKVWKGVNNALHTRRKWYGFWLGFLLLTTGGAVTWVMTTTSGSGKQNIATLKSNVPSTPSVQATIVGTEATQSMESLLPFDKQRFTPENIPSLHSELNFTGPSLQPVQEATSVQIPVTNIQHFSKNGIEADPSSAADRSPIISHVVTMPAAGVILTNDQSLTSKKEISPKVAEQTQSTRREISFPPLTIESVINAYQIKKIPKQISWQLFVTPTISYRKLSVNKSIDNPSAPNYPFASLSDVNSAVTHKPDIGLQIGLSGRYPISRNLKIRGGVQFNINRYDIKAFAFKEEVATIDLSGGPGNSTISTWTNYRNFNGYRQDWLKNFYFSVSAPIGVELKLFGNAKTNIGIAGTLQPTYILSDKAYLISTDFKNYAEVPRLIRHVNLNTSFETFVNYTSGKTNWQIGPQVRYQVLSSFQNKYPVKENLFDFGVKVGVSINK
jgi:hypothetical protein